jgi:hypothetical protein
MDAERRDVRWSIPAVGVIVGLSLAGLVHLKSISRDLPQTRCAIELPGGACPADPAFAIGQINGIKLDGWNGASVSAAQCAFRAEEIFKHCKAEAPVFARFYRNGVWITRDRYPRSPRD